MHDARREVAQIARYADIPRVTGRPQRKGFGHSFFGNGEKTQAGWPGGSGRRARDRAAAIARFRAARRNRR